MKFNNMNNKFNVINKTSAEERELRFRNSIHEFIKDRNDTVIKKWLNTIGYQDTIGYFLDTSISSIEYKLTIYTTHPGVLIGMGGKNIEILKEIIWNEFHHKVSIEFVEVFGGFISN